MPAPLSVGSFITALVLLLVSGLPCQSPSAQPKRTVPATESGSPGTPTTGKPVPKPVPSDGHLVLIVEGTHKALRVTHAVAKTSRFAPRKGLASEFAFVALDRRGREIASIPIDLSVFQTDPIKPGKPVIVRGCEVRTRQVSTLLNVPNTPGAASYQLRRGKMVLGRLSQAELQKLLRGGR